MLELAIGDAYGAGFEYVNERTIIEHNTLEGYHCHPRHEMGNGRYTDDTQMSLAIAEAIVDDEWNKQNLANRFVEVFKRDPREGYAGSFYTFLQSVKDGNEFLDLIKPRSDKSGAAMRAIPIGLFDSVGEVIEKSTLQAQITHNTADGINAAVAASLMSHYFVMNLGPKDQLPVFLTAHVPGSWDIPWFGQVGAKGWMSVRAAITAILDNDSLTSILRTSINYTGDVDTVATIAMGAASLSTEIEQDLPQVLFDELENGDFGRDYLCELDSALGM